MRAQGTKSIDVISRTVREKFGVCHLLRYTRFSFLIDERISRIPESVPRRPRGAFGGHFVEPERGRSADGGGGLPSASALWRNDAQQSCVPGGKSAGCARAARTAI